MKSYKVSLKKNLLLKSEAKGQSCVVNSEKLTKAPIKTLPKPKQSLKSIKVIKG